MDKNQLTDEVREAEKMQNNEVYKGPSLPLAYEQLKGIAISQIADGGHIDTKAAAMFALASALVSVVLPVTLVRLGVGHPPQQIEAMVLLSIVPVLLYVFVCFCFLRIYRLRDYQDFNNPKEIKSIIGLTEEAAYTSLFRVIERAHKNNKTIVDEKARQFERLFWAVGGQTLSVIIFCLWVAYSSVWFAV